MLLRRWWADEPWGTKAFLACCVAFVCMIVLGVNNAFVEEREFAKLPKAEQERILANRRADADRAARSSRAEADRISKVTAMRREAEEQQRAMEEFQDQIVEAHKASVKSCIETAKKYLPGLWPSNDAIAKIEADCAEREARSQ